MAKSPVTDRAHAICLTLPLWMWMAVREMAENDGLSTSAEIRIMLANEIRTAREQNVRHEVLETPDRGLATKEAGSEKSATGLSCAL